MRTTILLIIGLFIIGCTKPEINQYDQYPLDFDKMPGPLVYRIKKDSTEQKCKF